MQKKAKSKLTDILFVIVCIAGAVFSIFKFTTLFYQTLTKDEDPIALIQIKKNTVQRRFLDDLLWDRLRDTSPLYDGDTIRTAPVSEATVFINQNGDEIELLPSSMIQIFISADDKLDAKLQNGSVNARAGDAGFKLSFGDTELNLEKGSAISTDQDENGNLMMQVVDGQVIISNSNGTQTVISGNTATIQADGKIIKNHLNVVSPELSKKYLNFSDDKYLANFEWSCDEDTVLIETSDTRNFTTVTSSQLVKGSKRAALAINNGISFWRISTIPSNSSDSSFTEQVTGKINVIHSPPPVLIAPKNDSEFTYRTRNPLIHFTWEPVERASSYHLTVANNPAMDNPVISDRTTQTSSVFNTLSEGTWYWTVTPYYALNRIGLARPSEQGFFKITKSSMLTKPELTTPENNALVSTKIPLSNNADSYKTIYFSWKNDNEAESYNFRAWPENGSSANPAISRTEIKQNNVAVNAQTQNLTNGNWYWQVDKVDDEKNVVSSETRKFYAMDSKVEQRTVFPPDGYTVAQTRTQDLRFNWKTNIKEGTLFQIARDADFKKTVLSESAPGNSFSGRYLAAGTYYWRVTTKLGDVTFSSPAKKLIVDLPFKAPFPFNPANNGSAVMRPRTPYEFRWNAIAGADYYQVKIYRASNPTVALIDKNLIEASGGEMEGTKIYLDSLWEGNYILTLQAFRQETELASRSSGYAGTYNFNLKTLKPVELLTPQDDITIDGATAIRNPPTLSWQVVDEPVNMNLVIYKDKETPENEAYRIPSPGSPYKLPVLYEGNYLWRIEAYTKDGFDISSLETRKFTVTEIPKLNAPSMTEPKKNQSFGKEYFVENKKITFKWGRVSGADQYIFTLKNSKDEVIVTKTLNKNTTEYTLTDLTLLEKGRMTWEVEAQSLYKGVVFQHGKITPQRIKIDLNPITTPSVQKAGILYGN